MFLVSIDDTIKVLQSKFRLSSSGGFEKPRSELGRIRLSARPYISPSTLYRSEELELARLTAFMLALLCRFALMILTRITALTLSTPFFELRFTIARFIVTTFYLLVLFESLSKLG